MKVCLLCGETYGHSIDFCFRDGEVLSAIDAPQTGARRNVDTSSPTQALAASVPALDDEPDLTRANRRALMRAAAATYLAPGDPGRTPPPGLSTASGLSPALGLGAKGRPQEVVRTLTPVSIPPLDEGMGDHHWPSATHGDGPEEVPDDEPDEALTSPSSALVAGVIAALVVIAVALGAGLLVLVGLGQRPDPGPRATAELAADRREDARRTIATSTDASDHTPGRREELVTVATPGVAPPTSEAHLASEAERSVEANPVAAEFLVVLGDPAATDTSGLVLFVDGARAGVLPATVRLAPGEHTFLVVADPAGSFHLEVKRTIEVTAGDTVRRLSLAP